MLQVFAGLASIVGGCALISIWWGWHLGAGIGLIVVGALVAGGFIRDDDG